jgi:hypothetical protein
VEDVLQSPNTGLQSISAILEGKKASVPAEARHLGGALLEFDRVSFRYPLMEDTAVEGLSNVAAAYSAMGFAGAISLTALQAAQAGSEAASTDNRWASPRSKLRASAGPDLGSRRHVGRGKVDRGRTSMRAVTPVPGQGLLAR